MHPGARNFAYRKKPRDRSAAPNISPHTPHPVMRRGSYGNWFVSPIEASTAARRVDTWKPASQKIAPQLRRIEEHCCPPLGGHLHRNPASDNVTRCQLGVGMEHFHKAVTICIQ